MSEPLENLRLFKVIVKSLQIAIKNSVFYTFNHPICANSIRRFKVDLEKWFDTTGFIQFGVAEDTLFLDGKRVEEPEDYIIEIAKYLHERGITSITISKFVTFDELLTFFNMIKESRQTIQDNGGISRFIPDPSHIKIMEIDYRILLSGNTGEGESREGDLWESLIKLTKNSGQTDLPESKMKLLSELFKDTQKSAATLNKVYKEALHNLTDQQAVQDIRIAIYRICKYLEKYSDDESKTMKQNLLEIVSMLHPDFIARLFEETQVEGEAVQLTDEIRKGLSDDFIAEFITSLIIKEGSLNESLLRIFDKFMPPQPRANQIFTLITDQLLKKESLRSQTFNKIQTSIQEMMKQYPDSPFANEMYKITIESVLNQQVEALRCLGRLAPEVKTFEEHIGKNKLRKAKTELLLNILWLEKNTSEFEKISGLLINFIPELIQEKEGNCLFLILEFYKRNIRQLVKQNLQVEKIAITVVRKLVDKDLLNKMIFFIPEADEEGFKFIIAYLSLIKEQVTPLLLNAYIANSNMDIKDKLRTVLTHMQPVATKVVLERISGGNIAHLRDLFRILRDIDEIAFQKIKQKMIKQQKIHLLSEVLDEFIPQTQEEKQSLLAIFKKDKDIEIQKKTAVMLLKTRKTDIVNTIFLTINKERPKRRILPYLIEWCGQSKVKESTPYLKQIFMKRPFFPTHSKEDLRIAAGLSLVQLGTQESIDLFRAGSKKGSKYFRTACTKIQSKHLDRTDRYGSANN